MYKQVFWDEDDLGKVFTIETEEKEPEIFRKTHIPINKILINKVNPELEKIYPELTKNKELIINEEILFDYLENIKPASPKRTIIIKGSAGSGKSELCEAIRYQFLNSKKIIPIIFPRSEVSLNKIFNKINERFHSNLQYNSLLDYESKTIATHIVCEIDKLSQKLSKITKINEYFQEFSNNEQKVLRRLINIEGKIWPEFLPCLINSINEYKETINKIGDLKAEFKINPSIQEVLIRHFKGVFRNDKAISHFCKKINDIIHLIIRTYQEIPSFGEIIEEINKFDEYKHRILLIFEDATGLGFAKDLINFAYDRSLKPCDIILGLTDGYLQENISLKKNYQQRTDLILSTSDEKRSYFLNPNIILELSYRYLNTLKELYFKNNEDDNDKETDHIRRQVFDDRYYPFTKEALLNIYDNLLEDGKKKQTPRIFLTHAIKDILQRGKISDENTHYGIPYQGCFDIVLESKYSEFFTIFFIYGKPDIENKKALTIDRRIFDFLGYNLKDEIKKDLTKNGVLFKDNLIKIKLEIDIKIPEVTYIAKKISQISKLENIDADTKENTLIKLKNEHEDKKNEFINAKKNFSNWINKGTNLIKQQVLITSIQNCFKVLLPDYSTFGYLKYNFGESQIIEIQKLTKKAQQKMLKFYISINGDLNKKILNYLFSIELESEGNLEEQLLKYNKRDNQNVSITELLSWLNNCYRTFKTQLYEKLSDIGKINKLDFEKTIFLLKLFSIFITTGKRKIDYKTLIKNDLCSISEKIVKKCPKCNREIKEISCSNRSCNLVMNMTIPVFNKEEKQKFDDFLSQTDAIFKAIYTTSEKFWDLKKINDSFQYFCNDFNIANINMNYIELNQSHFAKLQEIDMIKDPEKRIRIWVKGLKKSELSINDYILQTQNIFKNIQYQLNTFCIQKRQKNLIDSMKCNLEEFSFLQLDDNNLSNIIDDIKTINNFELVPQKWEINTNKLSSNLSNEICELLEKWNYLKENHKFEKFFEVNEFIISFSRFMIENYEVKNELNKLYQIKSIYKTKIEKRSKKDEEKKIIENQYLQNRIKLQKSIKELKELFL